MARRVASLTEVSLFTDAEGKGNFVIEIDPEPNGRRTKCRVASWPEGELEKIEGRLATRGMNITHTEGAEAYFWARSKHLITVIGLVVEAFQGLYRFDPPEFWYHTTEDGEKEKEFRLEDTTPHSHTKIKLECTNWGIYPDQDGYNQQLETAVTALRESGLCLPLNIYHRDKTIHATLTDAAARRPLETFLRLVNLHPALGNGNTDADTATRLG